MGWAFRYAALSVPVTLIPKAPRKMKSSKAAGPYGIIAEMLKAAGDKVVELASQQTGAAFSCVVPPKGWEESFTLKLYKGKGEAHGNYGGLKLTDQVMKLLEWVVLHLREMVNIKEMQLG